MFAIYCGVYWFGEKLFFVARSVDKLALWLFEMVRKKYPAS